MSACAFCEIVAGRAAAHRLVVPRRHAEGLWDLDDEEHAQVARATSRVARLLRVALAPEAELEGLRQRVLARGARPARKGAP